VDGSVSARGVNGEFEFRCSSCGGVAARLSVTDGSGYVDGGPLPNGGRLVWSADGQPALRFEFLGVRTSQAPPELVELTANAASIAPWELRAIDRDLARFCCRECERNYCSDCWSTRVQYDEGFYDYTMGRCPEQHEQMLDD
jgi:hypothetical protein